MPSTANSDGVLEVTMTFNFQHVTPDDIIDKAKLAGSNLTNILIQEYGAWLETQEGASESLPSWTH
jgi:hypothetical protein